MYDAIPQPETESRDDYEAALRQGMTESEFARYDSWTSECEGELAFSLGWDPFTSNETPSEFLAGLGDVSFGERCGSQFHEDTAQVEV